MLCVRNVSFLIVKNSCFREEVSDVNKSLSKNILLVSYILSASAFVRAPPQLALFISPSPLTPWQMCGRQIPTFDIFQSPDKFTGNSKTRIYVYVYIYIVHPLRGQWNSSISRKMFLTLYLIHTHSLTLSALYRASNQLNHWTINPSINSSINTSID